MNRMMQREFKIITRIIFFICLITLCFISCSLSEEKSLSPKADRVGIIIEPELQERWEMTTNKHPLPSIDTYDFVLIPSSLEYNKNNLDHLIYVGETSWKDMRGPSDQISEKAQTLFTHFFTSKNNDESTQEISSCLPEECGYLKYIQILQSEWYAPVLYMWEQKQNISFDQFKQGMYTIKNIEDIKPPKGALAIDGFFFDDPNYPAVTHTYAILLSSQATEKPESTLEDTNENETIGTEVKEALTEWFLELEHGTTSPHITWIGGVGDIMVQRGVEDLLIGNKKGLEKVFTDTLPLLRQQDLLLGNLEGAVTTKREAFPKTYTFRFRPAVLPELKRAGFDYLSVANNHSYDYQEAGFIDTLKHLHDAGIATSGAGLTPAAAAQPWQVAIHNQQISVLSIGAFPRERSGFDGKKHAMVTSARAGILYAGPEAFQAVEKAFSKTEASESGRTFNIVSVHGGREWTERPRESQKELYRKLIDLGADVVLGHHPHYIQGMEAYKEGLIVYSLGNFIFPGMWVYPKAEESLILSLGVWNNQIRYIIPTPVRINNIPISIDHSGNILNNFLELTKELHD